MLVYVCAQTTVCVCSDYSMLRHTTTCYYNLHLCMQGLRVEVPPPKEVGRASMRAGVQDIQYLSIQYLKIVPQCLSIWHLNIRCGLVGAIWGDFGRGGVQSEAGSERRWRGRGDKNQFKT